ncbi:hypothetical protein, partial [Burkholderia glumae]|uniref:hypothetical protein n=1 Tax=Burkholderia glumae TaxID=337 RepID=UPI001E547E7B
AREPASPPRAPKHAAQMGQNGCRAARAESRQGTAGWELGAGNGGQRFAAGPGRHQSKRALNGRVVDSLQCGMAADRATPARAGAAA